MDDIQANDVLAQMYPDRVDPAPAAKDNQSEAKPDKPAADEPPADPDSAETGSDADDDADAEGEPDADADDGDADQDSEEDKPRKRLSGSERLKRRLMAAEAELASLRSRAPRDGEPSEKAIEERIGKKPSQTDFGDDILAFDRALTVWEMRAANAKDAIKAEGTAAERAAAERRAEMVEDHNERVDQLAKRLPDFVETMKAAGKAGLKASPAVEDLIIESDKSAQLLYHLAKNPDRLARLNTMSEREAAREIGRIESRLNLPAPKTKTSAPKPAAPVKGGSAAPSADAEIEAFISKTYGSRR